MKGNHDYWWSTKTKIDHFFASHDYSDFQVLHNCAYRIGEISVCGSRGWLYNSASEEDKKLSAERRVVCSPLFRMPEGWEEGPLFFCITRRPMTVWNAREILEILLKEGITDCYFGHIHGQQAARKAPIGSIRESKCIWFPAILWVSVPFL